MSLSIQTNSASTAIASNLSTTNKALAASLERLGTGLRINSAQDDAAGLQIANRLNSQMVGQKAGISNANNAISMLQTAEGSFEEMTNIVTRMQELATQSSNGVYSDGDREALNAEYTNLGEELKSILSNTTYGKGTNLLDADSGKLSGNISFQVGASSEEVLNVNISDELSAINTAVFQSDADQQTFDSAKTAFDSAQATFDAITGTPTTAEQTAYDNAKTTFEAAEKAYTDASPMGSLGTQDSSKTAMTKMQDLIDTLGGARSSLGANINRLGSTINNLSNMAEASEAAFGQIMDADFAEESANRSKQQMLLQSGVTVLTTANSTSQIISQLLR